MQKRKINIFQTLIGAVRRACSPELENELQQLKQQIQQLKQQIQQLEQQVQQQERQQEPEQPQESIPLLQNREWLTLMERLCEMVKRIRSRVKDIQESEEVAKRSPIPFLESLDSAIREAMLSSGAEDIDHETEYDILRHEAVPPRGTVLDRTPIEETLEFGVAVQKRVFIRALVKLKSHNPQQ